MALINCPECSSNVSSNAQACPQCGFAIVDWLRKEEAARLQQEAARIQREAAAKKKELDARNGKYLGIALLACMVSCCCCGIWGDREKSQREEAERKAAQLRAEQEAAQKAARIAETKLNLDTHVERLKIKIEGEDIESAKSIARLIQEAQPDHPYLANANAAIADIERKRLYQQKREESARLEQEAQQLVKGKRHLDAFGLYDQSINALSSIDDASRTKEDSEALLRINKLKDSISKQAQKEADKIQKDNAAAAKKAQEQQQKCGGATDCIEITAAEMCAQYNANEVRADEYFKDRTIVLTGTVREISKSAFDSMFLEIATGSACYFNIQALIPDEQKSTMIKLNKGDKVTLRCVGRGRAAITDAPSVGGCSLVYYWQ